MSAWFHRPEAIALLLLAPAAWIVLRLRDRARARRLAAALGPRASELAEAPRRRRRRVRRAAFAGALLFGGLAVLGPAWGAPVGRLAWRGVDLVLCLDVSRSMLARDLVPDRLARAKEQIRALGERARGDRMALVLFAGEARLAVPLTRDVASLAELADLADPASVPLGGSHLGAALERALDALAASDGRPRAVVLLTDGEDHEGRALPAAAACAARGVVVHAVGFGSAAGGRIVIEGEGLVQDAAGRPVRTTLDATGLARLTEATGGAYATAQQSDQPLVDLYERALLPTARATRSAAEGARREDRYQWPLLAAFLLLMLDLWLVDRTRR